MKTAKYIISFLLILLCAVSLCACKKKEKRITDETIETLREPTVMITVGEMRASGVVVSNTDDKITIISVAHLLDGYDQGIVTFLSGKVGFADVTYCDNVSDVAILEINKENFTSDFAAALKAADINLDKYEALKDGDEVTLIGSSTAVAGNVFKGTFKAKDYYVPEFDQYLLYLYCDALSGMSGAGCFDAEGNLLGLVTAASDSGEVLCIPIKDFIDRMEAVSND